MDKVFPTSQILINSNNYDKASNSFIYNFNSDQNLSNHCIGCQQIILYNQFYNVSASLGNNKVRVDFPSGASAYHSTEYTIPDGYYDSAETFSTWLQSQMLASSYVSFPNSSQTTYYLEMGTSKTEYAFTLTLYPVSTSTVPPKDSQSPPEDKSWSQLSSSARTPRIFFGALGKVFGFSTTQVYGTGLSTKTITNSPVAPQIRDSTTLVFSCNLVNNGGISFPSDFLYSLRIGNSFGSAIQSAPQEVLYSKVSPANYRQIIIKIYDQNMKPISIIDSNVMFLLLLRQNK
jgi:hypothetical protein